MEVIAWSIEGSSAYIRVTDRIYWMLSECEGYLSRAVMAQYTDIVHISPLPEGKHTGTRYVWVHPQIRPWGHQLPVQFPECLCIRPWESTSKGLVYSFGCQHCNHQMMFSPPPEKYSQLGGAVFGGRWLAVDHLE